jgi:hypothetical protein
MLVPVGPEGGCDLGQLARLLICCVSRMERGVGSEEPMYIVYSVHSYSSRPLRAIFNSSCSICMTVSDVRATGDHPLAWAPGSPPCMSYYTVHGLILIIRPYSLPTSTTPAFMPLLSTASDGAKLPTTTSICKQAYTRVQWVLFLF